MDSQKVNLTDAERGQLTAAEFATWIRLSSQIIALLAPSKTTFPEPRTLQDESLAIRLPKPSVLIPVRRIGPLEYEVSLKALSIEEREEFCRIKANSLVTFHEVD